MTEPTEFEARMAARREVAAGLYSETANRPRMTLWEAEEVRAEARRAATPPAPYQTPLQAIVTGAAKGIWAFRWYLIVFYLAIFTIAITTLASW